MSEVIDREVPDLISYTLTYKQGGEIGYIYLSTSFT